MILDVGEDHVILSSEHKIRLGAKITLGLVDEPVCLGGCESVASNYTELEMTTYDPVLRQNVKLVSIYVPKPGENSENVKLMVDVFDKAVNDALPSVAVEYGIANVDYIGCGLDPKSYVGDEGGALWKGLCLAKGATVKEKTVSDFFHFKQDLNRHKIYFQDSQSKNKFQSLMLDAYNAPTSVQADQAAKQLDVLIEKKSTNVKKMKGYKSWWWRRQARWQRWCRSQSASNASSAEVANAKSLRATGYRKRLLDVVTSECAGAVLEAAEKKRQSLGLKTVGRGPTVDSRTKTCRMQTARAREASADAVQALALEAAELESKESDHEFETMQNIQQAHDRFQINTRDSHRADKKKKVKRQKKTNGKRDNANKKQKNMFSKKVEGVHMDLLTCESSMRQFTFKILDTMGYVEEVTLKKSSSTCSSSWCSSRDCHHLLWVLHNVFKFGGDDQILYQTSFSDNQWQEVLDAFPKKVPTAGVRCFTEAEQTYSVNIRKTAQNAKCASCKTEICKNDVQATTEGHIEKFTKPG